MSLFSDPEVRKSFRLNIWIAGSFITLCATIVALYLPYHLYLYSRENGWEVAVAIMIEQPLILMFWLFCLFTIWLFVSLSRSTWRSLKERSRP